MGTISKKISKRFWDFILGLSRLWTKITRYDRSVKSLINDAFVSEMMQQIEHDNLTVDIENAIVVMSTSMYAKYICCGSFTFPDDYKAHRFFSNMRQFINLMRGYSNGSDMDKNKHLEFFANEAAVRFFVKREDGSAYLSGTETPYFLNINVVGDEKMYVNKDNSKHQS